MTSLRLWVKLLLGLFTDIYFSMTIAALPTLKAIWNKPSLLLTPREVSQTYMAFTWELFGAGIDENTRHIKKDLIIPWSKGIVLDIGAGHGHLANYLNRSRVSAYVALEPNARMHDALRAKAAESGFLEDDGTFLLIRCGVEETERIEQELDEWSRGWGREDGKVDTMVSLLTICSLPPRPSPVPVAPHLHTTYPFTPPALTLRALQSRLLRRGGMFLFYEHVRSPVRSIARTQDILAPIWRFFFDGCTIGVDGVRALWEAGFEAEEDRLLAAQSSKSGKSTRKGDEMYEMWKEEGGVRRWAAKEVGGGWKEMYAWGKEEESLDTLFWHQVGRCVKRD